MDTPIGLILIVAGVIFLLWKCQFGVDLTDESFYLLPAWKLFPLGDLPFVDEIFNGPRHADLLNYILVRPLVPFSVYALRISAVIFYVLVLLGFVKVCFERRIGIVAGLSFFGCLLFDWFLMPTWSYNWWCRNFLILHHIFLLWATSPSGERARSGKFFLAGVSAGIVAVAYNTASIAFLCAGFFLGLSSLLMEKASGSSLRRALRYYALGAILVLAVSLSYLLRPEVRSAWLDSLGSMASHPAYDTSALHRRTYNLVLYLSNQKEAWALAFILCFLFRPDWLERWLRAHFGFLRNPGSRRILERIGTGLFLVCVIFFLNQNRRASGNGDDFYLMFSLTFTGALYLALWGLAKKNYVVLWMVLCSLSIGAIMAICSVNGLMALSWIAPSILIPFAALIEKESAGILLHGALSKRIGYVALVFLFLAFDVRALRRQLTETYHDASPNGCVALLLFPPLQGLRTSLRKAQLIDELRKVVAGRERILAFGKLPGVFLFGKARSAVNTIFVDPNTPLAVNKHSFLEMKNRKHSPELIVRAKTHPWSWGLQPKPVRYSKGDPYSDFADCVRLKTLLNFEEYEVFSVDPGRVDRCMLQSIS